ncbi:MAG: 50S ribosomal protein L19e [Candidatus Diapherotrites archaeon]|nr:50S ribosomal protein L19e [Candidatus Diapherotrites archaeon]
MELNKLRALAAKTLKVGQSRIRIANAEKASEAITRDDVRTLHKEGAIKVLPPKGTSRGRARVLAAKKKAGRKTGAGKRKGTKKTREKKKAKWMTQVRAQRRALRKKKPLNYRTIYKMIKGGYFKSVKHLESFIAKE